MLRTILGIVMMLGLLMSGAVAGGEKKEEKKKGHHEKGKVTAKTDDSVTVEFTHKGKEHKRVIKLEDKMDLISESGKDVPIAEFLKGIEIGEEVIVVVDEGHVIAIRDIPEKKKSD